ncbi:MAG: FlgD immunoglobulin-like domain containing protein [Candidatus Krumholzibacteriia bacterium]
MAAPNPFNPQTRITYGLKTGRDVKVEVFDLRGRLVRRLIGGFQEAGEHEAVWRGEDAGGRRVASGVYLVRLHGSDIALTRRVMLLK